MLSIYLEESGKKNKFASFPEPMQTAGHIGQSRHGARSYVFVSCTFLQLLKLANAISLHSLASRSTIRKSTESAVGQRPELFLTPTQCFRAVSKR